MNQEQRKYHYDPATQKECEQILVSIQRQAAYVDRLLTRIRDLKHHAAGLDGTAVFVKSAQGSLREAHESLHYEIHGVGSGKWRHQRDVNIEKHITGQKD